MQSDPTSELRIKPRILIADDSRIVRATLIKHIQGLFEFREALDGEQAWETLLIDPAIRVVITDLTMPRLDGYGLLQRIRDSKLSRIRDIPVIVISGSDEQEERDRAKAAGATELITKGIATAQLLSRLDTLSQLVSTRQELERGLETLARRVPTGFESPTTSSVTAFVAAAEAMLAYATQHDKNFVLLNVCFQAKDEQAGMAPTPAAIQAIGQLLQSSVRQSDCVARTGDTEFTLATTGIGADAAHGFAQRICDAITRARLDDGESATLVASCGLVCLAEDGDRSSQLDELRAIAGRRAGLGLQRGSFGVISVRNEAALGAAR